jgi:membrane protease YdiL (CAAX protease family)
MNKVVLGLVVGGILGVLDGLTALFSGPALFRGSDWVGVLVGIVCGSTFKGLVAGVVTGFVARKLQNLPLGILVGLLAGAAVTFPIAWMQRDNPQTHENYFWAVMIPGTICGAIVGFATQRYGTAAARAAS